MFRASGAVLSEEEILRIGRKGNIRVRQSESEVGCWGGKMTQPEAESSRWGGAGGRQKERGSKEA